jgi:hypothetical protein
VSARATQGGAVSGGEAILSIPAAHPEVLFRGEADSVRTVYQRLASHWHPDRNPAPAATAVFQHLSVLYAAARRQIGAGLWKAACGETLLTGGDGRQHRIAHVARRSHELGELLIGPAQAAWLITAEARDLYDTGLSVLRSLRYASAAMREEISPCLPRIEAALQTPGHHVLVMHKPADMVLLADLCAHLGGRVPPEHVAWILSCLYNIACYLEWARLTHNAIGPDTVLVSPQRHAVLLLGGWWYAAPVGGRLLAVPQRTADTVAADILRTRTASARADLELIRATGRELLGDASGTLLQRDREVPRPLADALVHPGADCALSDYRRWRRTLHEAFGAPRFVPLTASPEQIYPTTPTLP